MTDILFDPKKFQTVQLQKGVSSNSTIENKEYVNNIRLCCYELGNTIDFMGNTIIYHSLPIQDIISTEVRIEKKRFGKKSLLAIETANGIIDIEKMSESETTALKQFLDIQKEKEALGNKSKKITFTAGGSTKTRTICPYSPIVLDDEEIILTTTTPEIGFVVTNYRAWKDYFFEVAGTCMTHDEYDDVIAANVQKRKEEDIVGGVNARSSLWNLVQHEVDISYNKSTHHATSTEIDFGDIVFMKDGKRVMIWEDFPDPNSTVNLINSAKAHFNTTPTAPSSSGGEDPIKALKLRFAKGEITKEEFLEMKSMLE